jgi:hypothetical protein
MASNSADLFIVAVVALPGNAVPAGGGHLSGNGVDGAGQVCGQPAIG